MINHHRNPLTSRAAWTTDKARLPGTPWLEKVDFVIMQDRIEARRQSANIDISLAKIDDDEVDALVAFLESFTGEQPQSRRFVIPATVPSGLPVDMPENKALQ